METKIPVTFDQRIKEKIDIAITELLPEDELLEKIRQQVTHFKTNHLPKLIEERIRARILESINAILALPKYNAQFSGYGEEFAGEAVAKVIAESAPLILAGLIGSSAQMVVNNLRSSLQQMTSNLNRPY